MRAASGIHAGKGSGPFQITAQICRGAVTYADRASLCSAERGAFVCSALEVAYTLSWVTNWRGKEEFVWVDDPLNVVVDGDYCMATSTSAGAYSGAGTSAASRG